MKRTVLAFIIAAAIIIQGAASAFAGYLPHMAEDVNEVSIVDFDRADYQQLIDRLLTTQYDALVTSDYSEIDDLFIQNDITSYYCDYLRYRVKTAFEFDNYWLNYEYNWKSFDTEEVDDTIYFAGIYDLNFTYASELDGLQPTVLINGLIEKMPTGLRISSIDTTESFYADLKDNLTSKGIIVTSRQQNSDYAWVGINTPIVSDAIASVNTNQVSSYLEEMFCGFQSNVAGTLEESTDVVSADPVLSRAASYSYNVNAGVSYANTWASSRNPKFVNDGRADCTRFVSQCIWSAYGEKMESSASLANWFGHQNGSGDPWESVKSLWNYSTTRTGVQTGPRASGYNNNSSYTGIAAYAMSPGNVVQFDTLSGLGYGHSVYVVSNNATNYDNYGAVVVAQHSSDGKYSIYDKLLAYGFNTNMRRLSFSTAQF